MIRTPKKLSFNLKRLILRLLIVILFLFCAFVLLYPFVLSRKSLSNFFLFLCFGVILTFAYFNITAAVGFAAAAVLITIIHALNSQTLSLLPPALIVTVSGLLYFYYFGVRRLAQNVFWETESIEEDKNVLSVNLDHLRLENNSFRQKLDRYKTVKTLTESLSSSLSFEAAVNLITEEGCRVIDKTSSCLLYLVDKEKQQLRLVSTRLLDPRREIKLKEGDIFDNWILRHRVPLLVQDVRKDFRFNIQPQEAQLRGVRSLISVPLISGSAISGVLRLENTRQDSYDADDLRLLDIVGDLAAVAVENSLLYDQMAKLAITDGLTELFVQRYFKERLDEEISRALWTDSEFALLMLDIDNFKTYNDKYGHIAGDIVLKHIARLINSTVNPGDITARYGGEEFAVIFLDSSKAQAQKIAERIRQVIEQEKFTLRREVTQVLISGGLAVFPQDGKVKEALIQKADQALYRAKREGKNRICTA